jgi:hypothetical protein
VGIVEDVEGLARILGCRFWHDVWCGNQTSKAAFPEFSKSRFKEVSVAYHLHFSNGTLQLDITFIRSVHD